MLRDFKPKALLRKPLWTLLISGALVCSCNTGPTHKSQAPWVSLADKPTESPSQLTRQRAQDRFKQISQSRLNGTSAGPKISYLLWFSLSETLPEFQGRTVVLFDLSKDAASINKKLQLDFEGGSIQSITINDVPVQNPTDPERFDGHLISFRISELNPSSNRIEIAYKHPYSSDGNGLHRFEDPVDHKTYTYTNFEPYNAHRVFPCFDQPDLKASYEITVEAPPTWTVISNTLDQEVSVLKDQRKAWIFPASPVFSTYLFALHAGPYAVWKANANGIPTRLFARASLASYVDSKEWLDITQRGLDFYGTQYGYPYPFKKYDQVIVPDFPSGAMENVGAVTFSENFIYRTKVTEDRRRSRADTILHEMAHMWFGDLVTMKWWNGLWLNESFASFMSHWAVDQATNFKGSWLSFSRMKNWAYWEDQLVTTHPVEMPVTDTMQAQSNFDGITYGKGASSLKQLRFYLGEDDFREGIQRYFQRFAYRNTNIHDFFKTLSEASNKNLVSWHKHWLQTSGVSSVRTSWNCSSDPSDPDAKPEISEFDYIQSPVRSRRTQIAFYSVDKPGGKGKGPGLTPSKILDVTSTLERTTVKEAIGLPCPDFVFANYEDQDYAKLDLDPKSLQFIHHHFDKIADPLVRQMLWHTLWEMVVDGKLPAGEFAEMVFKNGHREKDTQILDQLLGKMVNPFVYMPSVAKYLSPERRKEFTPKLEKFMMTGLMRSAPGSDFQLIWYRHFLDSAKTPETLLWIKKLLLGKIRVSGLRIDQERRWDLVQTLSRSGGLENIQEVIAAELSRDQTDKGQKQAISAQAQNLDPAEKKKWLKRILRADTTEQISVPKLVEAMESYQVLEQENATKESVDAFFQLVGTFENSPVEDEVFNRDFARFMYPSLCTAEMAKRTEDFLKSHPGLKSPILKSLWISHQEEERCVRARNSGS